MDTVTLKDRQTGHVAVIRQPLIEYLAPDELITLEDTIQSWGNMRTEHEAEERLDTLAAGSPERVVYGLLWLAGLWCSLCAARLGVPVEDFIAGLDYQGLRRDLSGMDDEGWTIVTQLVRRGVLAVVTSEADVQEYLRIVKKLHKLGPSLRSLRRHVLIILDGLPRTWSGTTLPLGVPPHMSSLGAAGRPDALGVYALTVPNAFVDVTATTHP